MTPKEFASSIDGLEYPVRIPEHLLRLAKDDGLVIVYGASDDLMEFEGAISDEVGCYNGGTAYLTKDGLLTNECDDDQCPYFEKLKKAARWIEAVWSQDGYSWTYRTKIPHETFEVVEDGEKYCRGIVFALADVQ